MSDYNQRLVAMLAEGYPDAACILGSYDAKTGEAVLNPADSLGHFVVSEALAVTDGEEDRPRAPLAFEVGLAMQRASTELARLAEHCRQAGITQMVEAFLRETRDAKKKTFSKENFEAWLQVYGDEDTKLMLVEFELCLLRYFPEQTRGPGPWIVTRQDLLNVKLADTV